MERDIENRVFLDFIRKIKGVEGFGARGDIIKVKLLEEGWGHGMVTGQETGGEADLRSRPASNRRYRLGRALSTSWLW